MHAVEDVTGIREETEVQRTTHCFKSRLQSLAQKVQVRQLGLWSQFQSPVLWNIIGAKHWV